MLNSINLNDKTYEELMAEALSRIPMYTDEWTNFNTSDPGITILQNLTAFNLLQQSYINQVGEPIRRKLLKLLGIVPQPNRAARVLLEAQTDRPLRLQQHMRFKASDLVFETDRETVLNPWRIAAFYSENEGVYRDLTYLLNRDVRAGTEVFGPNPRPGIALYCILSGKPETGKQIILYAHAGHHGIRNPIDSLSDLRFAEVSWQYYTEGGWREAQAEDGTYAFITDGEIRLTLDDEPAVFTDTPTEGYAFRCVLVKSEYDIPPRLRSLTANLFEVYQRSTHSASFRFHGANRIVIDSELAAYGYVFIYCREEKGGAYKAYKEYAGGRRTNGRYYRKEIRDDGSVEIEFDRKLFGYAPGRGFGAILAVCCTEEAVLHRSLGTVYGYDEQIIDIDIKGNIIEEGFRLLVETYDAEGEPEYTVAEPGETNPDMLCFNILHETGQIIVNHPGLGGGFNLYLCDFRTTSGGEGNIREKNTFKPAFAGGLSDTEFVNPASGCEGNSYETAEQLRSRFVADIKGTSAAVLVSDYEYLVKNTPGLCIHKVKAFYSEDSNTVKIAVKPYTAEKYPKLSQQYIEQIKAYLEPRRLVTTGIEILQPTYIPVDVHAVVIIKDKFEGAKDEIEKEIREELDFTASERTFGETVRFNDIFRTVEELEFVDSIYSLSLISRSLRDYEVVGNDIRLGNSCLCIPGNITVELHTKFGKYS